MSTFLPIPSGPTLTAEEVAMLPSGTPIMVAWGAAFYAKRYTLGRGSSARAYAMSKGGGMVEFLDETARVWLAPVKTPKVESALLGRKV